MGGEVEEETWSRREGGLQREGKVRRGMRKKR